jgi:EmrB/QacA subfamily drug resistance transporter
MAFLDGTVVNVALPVMQADLRVRVDLVQWIVEAYSLLLAALVLVGGALGDRLGRKRVFLAGVILFALASMACGIAPTAMLLIVARAVQGIGAALLVPGSLSLISAAYSDKEERGAAIGTWSAFSAMTAAIGPVAGGWVVAHASWRWLFLFNAPVAALILVFARKRVAETRDESAPERMDWVGASLATVGLGLIVYGLVDSARQAGTARLVLFVGVGVVILIAFVAVEARCASPMVPLSLFRSRSFSGANLLTLFLYAALGGAFFFVPFNLIQVQGYTPAAAGAALLPFVVLVSAMSRWAGGLVGRLGARLPLVLGPLLAALGFALLAVPGTAGSYWTTFFPGIAVLGLGMGLTVAPLTATVMGSVEARHGGVASGVNNAVSRAAGLLAIAVLGVVLLARFNGVVDQTLAGMSLPLDVRTFVDAQRSKLGGADFSALDPALRESLRRAFADAYVAGFRTVMIVSAVLAALGALAALWLIDPVIPGRPRRLPAPKNVVFGGPHPTAMGRSRRLVRRDAGGEHLRDADDGALRVRLVRVSLPAADDLTVLCDEIETEAAVGEGEDLEVRSVDAICEDGDDARFCARRAAVALGGEDDLAVARAKAEVRLSVFALERLEALEAGGRARAVDHANEGAHRDGRAIGVRLRNVGLARADDGAVESLEVEVVLAVGGLLHVEHRGVRPVRLDRSDADVGRLLRRVALRAEDVLSVAGDEVEVRFPVGAHEGFEVRALRHDGRRVVVGRPGVGRSAACRDAEGEQGEGGETTNGENIGTHVGAMLRDEPFYLD